MTQFIRPASEADGRFANLSALVEQLMDELRVPGVALGLLADGAEQVAGFGVTSVEHPLAVDGDTLFQIGSTTKTVTGTLVMRLVAAGQLDLDAPLVAILPELRLADGGVTGRVTMRHLLAHTGGWLGDFFDDTGMGDDALARMVAAVGDLPQLTPLGEIWSYNNAGFYIAGLVIERLTGRRYEDVVAEDLLAPLGMDHSFFFLDDVITRRFAVGHEIVYDDPAARPTVARPWALARSAAPVGGLVSSARDQLRYARFHMGDGTAPDGTRLLPAALLREMQTPVTAAANGEDVALTWFVREAAGLQVVRHGGATKGQLSAFHMVPAENFAITVLTNSERGGELHRQVVQEALRSYLGIEPTTPQAVVASPAQLAAYVGSYTGGLNDLELTPHPDGLELRVVAKGGFPRRDSPPGPAVPPVRAVLCGDDRILLVDPPLRDTVGEFLRDSHDQVAYLRIFGRTYPRRSA